MSQLRVVIVEDHALVRAGMRALLQKIDGIEVVSDVGDGWEAIKSVQSTAPDLVLIASGDHVYSMDYRPLIAQHLATGAARSRRWATGSSPRSTVPAGR